MGSGTARSAFGGGHSVGIRSRSRGHEGLVMGGREGTVPWVWAQPWLGGGGRRKLTISTIFGHLVLHMLFALSQNLNLSEPQLPHL